MLSLLLGFTLATPIDLTGIQLAPQSKLIASTNLALVKENDMDADLDFFSDSAGLSKRKIVLIDAQGGSAIKAKTNLGVKIKETPMKNSHVGSAPPPAAAPPSPPSPPAGGAPGGPGGDAGAPGAPGGDAPPADSAPDAPSQ